MGWLLILIFGLDQEFAVGVLLLGLCPGGSTSNYICLVSSGDGALSVMLTAISGLITAFVLPIILKLVVEHCMSSETADGADISIDVGELIMGIFILSIIPIGIGMAWIHFQPNLTERLQKPLKILAALLISALWWLPL